MALDPLELSPFTSKDMLVKHALSVLGEDTQLLDASRGGPNWQQRSIQCAWHVLGMYADYCFGGPVEQPIIRLLPSGASLNHSAHFDRFAEAVVPLRETFDIGVSYLHKAWQYLAAEILPGELRSNIIGALTAAITGAYYPTPPTLDFVKPVAHRYLAHMFGTSLIGESFDVYLDNGATAAFGQVVSTMSRNRLINPGDKVAMVWPSYEPMKDLFTNQYGCGVVEIRRERSRNWQVVAEDLGKLADPAVKVLVIVSPGNPIDSILDSEFLDHIEGVVNRRPELVILSDNVYTNFIAPGADNAMARMPRNVIPFYAPSKDFGLAGARIGVSWIHTASVLDALLQQQAPEVAAEVDAFYKTRWAGGRPSFYNRLLMDAASVSFSHMSGLSGPAQVIFTLCALLPLMAPDEAASYFHWLREELAGRMAALYEGLGIELSGDRFDFCSNYCTLVPLDEVAAAQGPECARAFSQVPLWDFLKHLAHSRATIIMPGPAFGGEDRSARICLTSLGKTSYREVGRNIAEAISDHTLSTPCPQCDGNF